LTLSIRRTFSSLLFWFFESPSRMPSSIRNQMNVSTMTPFRLRSSGLQVSRDYSTPNCIRSFRPPSVSVQPFNAMTLCMQQEVTELPLGGTCFPYPFCDFQTNPEITPANVTCNSYFRVAAESFKFVLGSGRFPTVPSVLVSK
jgi:hypothetical protein